MLGLPAELLQIGSLLKVGDDDQKVAMDDSIEEGMNLSVCVRCNNMYELSDSVTLSDSMCVDCSKISDDTPVIILCPHCSKDPCTCQFQCQYCPDSFLSAVLLQKHTLAHSSGSDKVCPSCLKENAECDSAKHACSARFICHLCGGGLSSSNSLKNHLKKHEGDLPHRCQFCNKGFIKPSEYRRHLRVHSGVKIAPRNLQNCDICSKPFARPADLRRHLATHSIDRPFACAVCGLAFKDTSNLKKHVSTHKVDEKKSQVGYHCSYCSKAFAHSAELRRHSAIHDKNEPFSCAFCGLATGDSSHLRKHVRIHARAGLRDCAVCQARFESFEELAAHIDKHPQGVKSESFECDVCGKAFSSKIYLSSHRAGHTEPRPFQCYACLKTFKTLPTLKNHLLTHTDDKGQVCPVCGKGFLTKSSLKRHEAIHSRPSDRFIHHLPRGAGELIPQAQQNHKSSPAASCGDFELKLSSSLPTHSQSLLNDTSDRRSPTGHSRSDRQYQSGNCLPTSNEVRSTL